MPPSWKPSKGRRVKRSSLWLSALLFGAAGCARQDAGGTTVARIDNTVLTLEHVRAQFDSASGVSDAQLQQYIQRWMNDELLFAEAQRRNLTQTPEIERHLTDMRRRLAIQALLDEEIYNTANTVNSESDVREYFNAHKSEFTLTRDAVLVSFVLLNSRDAATEFRNAMLRGTSWTKALADLLAGSNASHVLSVSDSAYYTQATLAPQELWRGAMNMKENEPSFPISTTSGFYVLIPWKVFRQGQTADLGYARPEIEERLTIERRRRKYEGLLANLRATHDVQVLVSGVPAPAASGTPGREE